MKKVVIINGCGGVGKDTLIGFVSKVWSTSMASSITPVKVVAERAGWEGEKDNKARKFLSDLKKIMTEYNDAPFDYCRTMLKGFSETDEEILFIQIREPEEIDRFKKFVEGINGIDVCTLLIEDSRRNDTYGNQSDDNVRNYNYDFVYDNCVPLKDTEKKFIEFFKNNIMIK